MKAELGGGVPWLDLLHSAAVKAGKSPAAAKRVPRLSSILTRLTEAMPEVAQLHKSPTARQQGAQVCHVSELLGRLLRKPDEEREYQCM
jgi:hypothetical protein